MRVLLVGAGAVGQVYGRALQLGGAEIAFYVKEKYAAEVRAGLTMYALNSKPTWAPVVFDGYDVLTTPAELAAQTFDQVWLCISSTALQSGWFDEFAKAMGDATLVTLQPGLEQRAWLAERVPAERTVAGAIAFISFQAPLEGASDPSTPGVAFWYPPLQKSPFSGPEASVRAILGALKRGGCPASKAKDAAKWAASPTAVMMPHLAALEACNWEFARLKKDERLCVAAQASREGMTISAAHYGAGAPFSRHFIRPWVMRIVLWLAPKVIPFDIETYIRYHFTKVGDQTRYLLRDVIDRGSTLGLPVAASQRLLQEIS